MNYEQFVYWLSGYLSGGRDNDNDVVIEDILKAIKEVKNTNTQSVIYYGEL